MAFVATRRALLGRGQRKWPPADWWTVAGQTCVAAYQPIGAPSLAASYVNLANPGTYDAAPGVAPTFDSATGWTFDGVTQYLDSGVILAYEHSYFIRFSDLDTGGDFDTIFGVATPAYRIFPNRYGDTRYYYNSLYVNFPHGGSRVDGILGMVNNLGYYNGVHEGTVDAEVGANVEFSAYIGAGNYSNSMYLPCKTKIQAIAIYSTTLSASDVAALTARMQAL
jgi:hypothetical protein